MQADVVRGHEKHVDPTRTMSLSSAPNPHHFLIISHSAPKETPPHPPTSRYAHSLLHNAPHRNDSHDSWHGDRGDRYFDLFENGNLAGDIGCTGLVFCVAKKKCRFLFLDCFQDMKTYNHWLGCFFALVWLQSLAFLDYRLLTALSWEGLSLETRVSVNPCCILPSQFSRS